jgi:glutathione S-transferase
MRLLYTAPSPFARKCRIVAREKGLVGRVEEVLTDPYANDPPLVAANPIAQVPALVDDDGSVFTDSPIICAYLDEIGQGPRLLPAAGPEHWRVRRLAALADGALEMGVKLVLEKRRPEHERSASWMERWRAGLLRALDTVEAAIPAGPIADMGADMAGITIVTCATWLDFRHPELDWRSGRPRIAALQTALEARDSFKETTPR